MGVMSRAFARLAEPVPVELLADVLRFLRNDKHPPAIAALITDFFMLDAITLHFTRFDPNTGKIAAKFLAGRHWFVEGLFPKAGSLPTQSPDAEVPHPFAAEMSRAPDTS